MTRWWRLWRWKRERRSLEVYLYNHGTTGKWISVREENTRLGVWKGWPL
jgi:hypothetical protein